MSLEGKKSYFLAKILQKTATVDVAELSMAVRLRQAKVITKVIHTKYSKHCPSTVAHTFECVCSKINHGLNHGLFISLLKLINCPIH